MSTARILGFPVLALFKGVLKEAGPLSSHRSMMSSTEMRGDASDFKSLNFSGSRLCENTGQRGKPDEQWGKAISNQNVYEKVMWELKDFLNTKKQKLNKL